MSREVFGKEEMLLSDLAFVVAETLNDAYPEVAENLSRVNLFSIDLIGCMTLMLSLFPVFIIHYINLNLLYIKCSFA